MAVIEKRHGIRFDPAWEPHVRFGIPPELEGFITVLYEAAYDPIACTFWISPEFRTKELTLSRFASDTAVHENISEERYKLR